MPTNPIFKTAQTVYETWVFVKQCFFQSPPRLPSYTVATLPDATKHERGIIYVSDGTAGSRFRGSNGTAWVNLG